MSQPQAQVPYYGPERRDVGRGVRTKEDLSFQPLPHATLPISTIIGLFEQQAQLADILQQRLLELDMRLEQSILRAAPPKEASMPQHGPPGQASPSSSSPYALMLNHHNQRLQTMVNIIENCLERLEV